MKNETGLAVWCPAWVDNPGHPSAGKEVMMSI